MANPKEAFSRRAILNAAARMTPLLLLGGGALWLGTPDSSRVKSQGDTPVNTPNSSPDANLWSPIDIPATSALMRVNFAALHQRPDIGLKDLYIGASDRLPAIYICTLWDDGAVKYRQSKFKLEGDVGFQLIEEPFSPDPSKINPYEMQVPDIPMILSFNGVMTAEVEKALGRRFDLEAHRIDIVPRPPFGKRFALVFGEESVEYKNKPSAISYLGIGFSFEQQKTLSGKVI